MRFPTRIRPLRAAKRRCIFCHPPRTEARGFQRGTARRLYVPVGNFPPVRWGSAGRYRVRARCVGPTRGVLYSASVRTRYPIAPCIPFVSERRRGCTWSHLSARPGTSRAIGLPDLSATVGRHKRARVVFCLPHCHGLGDALAGTVWWPSSSRRIPIQPPVFARCAYHAVRCQTTYFRRLCPQCWIHSPPRTVELSPRFSIIRTTTSSHSPGPTGRPLKPLFNTRS